jgi:hypothetical protein
MRICIVRPSRFITSAVDERRALVPKSDDAIAKSGFHLVEAIALIGTLGAFFLLFAVLVFIILKV